MHYNMNFEPHIAALLFLGSAGLAILLVIATVVFFFWRRRWVRYSAGALAALLLGYAALLLAFSAFSHDLTLARGEEKYFCGLDCHLAYSVQNVERLKTIGDTTAAGEFYIVTVRTRFDETTIAPWRGNGPLTPDPLDIVLLDDQGHVLGQSSAGQKAWDAAHDRPRSWRAPDPLRPGESYETTAVFDVPAGTGAPRLLVYFSTFPTQVLIGDENSVLHKKTYFSL